MYLTPNFRYRLLITSLLLSLLSWGIYQYFHPASPSVARTVSKGIPKDMHLFQEEIGQINQKLKAENGTPENPWARYEYEIRRLQDPNTGQIPQQIREKELQFTQKILAKSASLKNGNAQDWVRRGPFNIGGRTRGAGIDVSNEQVILAGGVSGGMWRSEDGGNSWTKTTTPEQFQSVTALAQDTRPGQTQTWYQGTGELRGNSASGGGGALYRGNGIFKSEDGGRSWAVLPATTNNQPQVFNSMFQYVWNLAVDAANMQEDEVYAATFGGINRSTDGGATWTNVLGNDSNFVARYTDVAITSNGVVYATLSKTNLTNQAVGTSGFFRSADGINWTEITPPLLQGPSIRYERTVIGISPSEENIVYFLSDTPIFGGIGTSLWRYNANTGEWTNLSNSIPNSAIEAARYNSQGSYNMLVKVKPDDPNVVFIGGTNLYRSTNGFSTPTATTWIGGYNAFAQNFSLYPNHHPDQHQLLFYPSNPNRVLSVHDGGVTRSESILAPIVDWESLNRGYFTSQFYTIALDPDSDLIIGGMQDNGTFLSEVEDEVEPWTRVIGGDGAYCAVTTNFLVSSAQRGQIFLFGFDNFGNSQGVQRIDPEGSGGYLFINPFVINPNNQFEMFLPAGDTLWYNPNLGGIELGGEDTNDQISTNWRVLTRFADFRETISAIEVSTEPEDIVYYGTASGRLFRLTDFSQTNPQIDEITSSSFPENGYVSSIAIDPRDANRVLVAFSNYSVLSLFYSTDGGQSWQAVAGNLEENPDGTGNGPSVGWTAILPLSGGNTVFFAGTSTGLFSTQSLDGSNTEWIIEGGETIGQSVVDMIRVRPSDGLVVVATHGNGIYSTRYANVVENPIGIESTNLLAPYPNPFSNFTTIEYELREAGTVNIEILDIHGQEIVSLLKVVQNPGRRQFIWNGTNASGAPLPPGTYICRMTASDQIKSKKIVLVR